MRWVLAGLLVGGMMMAMVPASVSALTPCTITGTPGDDVFDDGPYRPGVVICGRGGDDRVTRLAGATFRGGPGKDPIRAMTGGVFDGGSGADVVKGLHGGKVLVGRRGGDGVADVMTDGTFRGGLGHDFVEVWKAARSWLDPRTTTFRGCAAASTPVATPSTSSRSWTMAPSSGALARTLSGRFAWQAYSRAAPVTTRSGPKLAGPTSVGKAWTMCGDLGAAPSMVVRASSIPHLVECVDSPPASYVNVEQVTGEP